VVITAAKVEDDEVADGRSVLIWTADIGYH
jgi:hypothetical protein